MLRSSAILALKLAASKAASKAGKLNADIILVHAGTNNLSSTKPQQLSTEIIDRLSKIQNSTKILRKFLHLFSREYQFEQLVNSYTRVAVTNSSSNSPNVTRTLIDHFSANKPNFILKKEILKSGMVDHYMIYGTRKCHQE